MEVTFDKPPLEAVYLAHFGVKGMRWGVRRDKAKNSANVPMSDRDKAVLKKAGVSPDISDSINEKYGPGSLAKSPEQRGLTSRQKKVLVGGAIAAITLGAAATAYYLRTRGLTPVKSLTNDFDRSHITDIGHRTWLARTRADHAGVTVPGSAHFQKSFHTFYDARIERQLGYTKAFRDKLPTDPVDLKAGTILKRLSTGPEVDINPDGFFASYKDSDAERYKAILPAFWKKQGAPDGIDGYIVRLKAGKDIKAPSVKKTFDMYQEMLGEDITITKRSGETITRKFRDTLGLMQHQREMDDATLAMDLFHRDSTNWSRNGDNTVRFFNKIRGQGYNAVIDINDAGTLAERPLRILDGSHFTVDGHDLVSAKDIVAAQNNIKELGQ